jgi:hypothetical protein
MNTWNDPVQYQMLMDLLKFSNNAMIELPREFIKGCKVESFVTPPVAYDIATTYCHIPKQDLTTFLLAIHFAADSTNMEGLTRTRNDFPWKHNEIVQITPYHAANGVSTTCLNK